MVNGEIDNSSLNHPLGPVLTSASLPLSLLDPGPSIRGSSALRCFAALLNAQDGLATWCTASACAAIMASISSAGANARR